MTGDKTEQEEHRVPVLYGHFIKERHGEASQRTESRSHATTPWKTPSHRGATWETLQFRRQWMREIIGQTISGL